MSAYNAAPKTQDLAAYLAKNKPRIDARLHQILVEKTGQAEQLDPVYGQLLKTIASLVGRGGKRLRPILTLLAYEGFGGKQHKAILQVAASQELFHAFILMHDDVIDRDQMRWGGPNIAGSYFEQFSQTMSARDALHFAEAWELMAGDICLNLSQETLRDSGFDAELLLKASAVAQQTLFEVIGGEVLDVAMSLQDLELSEERLLTICRYKTAAYTFRAPLQIGALLAGADDVALKRIEDCATNLGIAFQLQDDLLGMFGDQIVTGKSTLSDLREGKRTLLLLHGLRSASKAEQKIITQILGNQNITFTDLRAVRKILRKTGAHNQVEIAAQTHLQKALKSLPMLGFNPQTTDLLTQLVNYTVNRSH